MNICSKIWRKLLKLRLQPIRVFCFHQVSESFDASTMWDGDWISVNDFKKRVLSMQAEGYKFISLQDAHAHVRQDMIRFRRYAVLTTDDGDKTIGGIIPWLAERNIPLTLFVCPAFLEGEQREGKPRPMLLKKDVEDVVAQYPHLISIGNHSMRHIYSTSLTEADFAEDVQQAESYLNQFLNKIPFFAYPNGFHSVQTDDYLHTADIIPVYCDGQKNYNEADVIHREII